MPDWLSLYHSLPYPLRVLAASARGAYLRWWRYGPETERLVEEALERETWSPERWKTWQEERLAWMLHHAATQVPYYREQWARRRRQGDRASWEVLSNWNIVQKDTLRENPQAFIADGSRNKRLFIDHTGGTTGTPTLVYQSREVLHKWYALLEARMRRWYGVSYHDKWGIFGGQKVVSLFQKKAPFWVINYGLNQIYFSVFHINRETVQDYIEGLKQFSPTHLIVYPSVFAVLAKWVLEFNLRPPPLRVIFSNSEILFNHQREIIEKAFLCPVVNTYGMAEMVFGASECASGHMHAWPEVGIVETTNSSPEGDFIFTGLLNEDMPLIRYQNGDSGAIPVWGEKFSCDKRLPTFNIIYGRQNDLIVAPDGRKLYLLDSLFNGLPLVEVQLIQKSIVEIVLKVVPIYTEAQNQFILELKKRVRDYVGNIEVDIEIVERIPREHNGKFRPYVSLIHE